MNTDNFDKEIEVLYQQRKRRLVVPEVNVNTPPNSRSIKQYLLRNLIIFFSAGTASFGIFAIISHLVDSPEKKEVLHVFEHTVTIVDIKPSVNSDIFPAITLPAKPVTANKPDSNTVISSLPIVAPSQSLQKSDITLDLAAVDVVMLPQLTQPNVLLTPIYKVMPEYSTKAIKRNYIGEIKLSYKVAPSGEVMDINIIESNANKLLQKSAEQALSKWKYPEGNLEQATYQVVFEFTLNNKG